MSNGQAALGTLVFSLLVFGIASENGHDFWHSALFALIFGPILWLIAAAQTVVTVIDNKEKKQ